MSTSFNLDHVAIATTDIATMFDALVGDLGGTVFHGGDGYGFRWVQTRLGDATRGMTVESLVVWEPEVDDFLARFVDRHGGGAHHITFKVPDINATIDACRSRGITPVGIRLDDPHWREAFLMPSAAHGTVIQLAQTDEDLDLDHVLASVAQDGPSGDPTWWPTPPTPGPESVALEHVVIGSPDVVATVAFFVTLLEGTVTHRGADGTELTWTNGARLRVEPAPRAGVVRLDAVGGRARTLDVSGVPIVAR